jgi:hypothetical protein
LSQRSNSSCENPDKQRALLSKKYLSRILQSTPKTVKVQNSIKVGDQTSDQALDSHAVLVEFGDMKSESNRKRVNGSSGEQSLRPPSRVQFDSQEESKSIAKQNFGKQKAGGITPRSKISLISALQQIHEERKVSGKDFIEEPSSPETRFFTPWTTLAFSLQLKRTSQTLKYRSTPTAVALSLLSATLRLCLINKTFRIRRHTCQTTKPML